METSLDSPLDLAASLAGCTDTEAAARITTILDHAAATSARLTAAETAVCALLADPERGAALAGGLSLGLVETVIRRVVEAAGAGDRAEIHGAGHCLLEASRQPPVLRRIAEAEHRERWSELILSLVDATDFTFPALWSQRTARYGPRTLFRIAGPDGRTREVSWEQAAGRVDLLARALLSMDDVAGGAPVAILSRNCLAMALLDLACLSSGIVNVMVPATATRDEVAYILRHSRAGLVAASEQHLETVLRVRDEVPDLHTVVALDGRTLPRGVLSLDQLLERSGATRPAELAQRRSSTSIADRASVMYTSGTTGTPKGIGFNHRNIVFKRFARALALPEIGEDDRFLCYLPLFHTFGRFLEMTGCVFWGATYTFAPSPAIGDLVRRMQTDRPTVFISIPLKWSQLYDTIAREVDVEADPDEDIRAAVAGITGGRLRWGLSAAGYLDPAVFRFFQRYGVELMSGFGMTEATGGITMTPPGGYRDDSLGRALPGIELKLADDGELMIRGPYVTTGYVDPPDDAPGFDPQGWLPTGDIMEADDDGFLRIVDRKKEIYKNAKGQTVAPQKIENLFRDFPSVGRIFLVGDHRPYNTALIWPAPDASELDLATMSDAEVKGHFRSLVVSVNSFLAPYERIVDFAILDRDLSADRDELTAKGTFRRKVVERHFADTIRLLYRRTAVSVGGIEVVVPNWLFQSLGLTSGAVTAASGRLSLGEANPGVRIRRLDDDVVQVGAVRYEHAHRSLDLGLLLSTPRLWLGNEELVDLAPLTPAERDRKRSEAHGIGWRDREGPLQATEEQRRQAADLLHRHELELEHLHLAALLLGAADDDDVELALDLLEHLVEHATEELAEPVRMVLRRGSTLPGAAARRRAFRLLFPVEHADRARQTLVSFLDAPEPVFDETTVAVLAARSLGRAHVEAAGAEASQRSTAPRPSDEQQSAVSGLLGFLAAYGAAHPSSYPDIRAVLVRAAMLAPDAAVRAAADEGRAVLEAGFRRWLGASSVLAVDPETGTEYGWRDVVVFADDVPPDDRERLLDALSDTPLLREAGFLFTGSSTVRLEDILPGGVWVSGLGASHGKRVYRLAIRTRGRDQLDIAVNLACGLSREAVEDEVAWLILCGDERTATPLVERLGGYRPEHGLWTEEFIPGETLDRALVRLANRPGDPDRVRGFWPYALWSAVGAYVEFWSRTGRRLVVADAGPQNVIVPLHDYQTDARLVSITARQPFSSVVDLLMGFQQMLVMPVESAHPELAGEAGWEVVLSAFTEIVGEEHARSLLEEARGAAPTALAEAITGFLALLDGGGFLPRRLFFAVRRYRRWQRLNPDATVEAKAATLLELYQTYGLDRLADRHPEVRPRFFRKTVFRGHDGDLADGLDALVDQLRRGELSREDLGASVADLRARLGADEEDDYFLARLSYPHLRPEDQAGFITSAAPSGSQTEMVVARLDREGRPFSIRHALTTREVGRLHQMFLNAKLDVQFRPSDRFMVAVTERGHLMGGLFYRIDDEIQRAHMDKIVVAERFQGGGVARQLLDELCHRLASAGIRSLTTGFFRPEFFYRHGFTVERRYAGLVRRLDTDEQTG